ncbi:MAG: DNA replication/repair protein RecF [Clostridiales bacterium]|jgi:DNA replication and repair protein RecF|nr:DNA replication/repair protein RecF [Clostridiales bacterium]
MVIKQLELNGFRNYGYAKTGFSPGINVITGKNAQGKTNLLEAMYYLSGAKSFRTRKDRELINFLSDEASVEADIWGNGRDYRLNIRLSRTSRKKITINGVRKKTASELSGKLCTVLFCPGDLDMIKGAASERRRFMDLAIAQLRPKYALLLTEYGRIYEHKTRILRDYKEKPDLLEVLDDFNIKLAKTGTELIFYRAAWCKKLSGFASQMHREISGGSENLSVRYKTVSTLDNPEESKPSEIFKALTEHQRQYRKVELDSGLCLSGAHKDELEMTINDAAVRVFASQGQIRTCALSLKLAEREISCNDMGEYPVLLLDDVLSELDLDRQDFMLNKITGGQVFITCCEGENIEKKTGGTIIRVHAGSIKQ